MNYAAAERAWKAGKFKVGGSTGKVLGREGDEKKDGKVETGDVVECRGEEEKQRGKEGTSKDGGDTPPPPSPYVKEVMLIDISESTLDSPLSSSSTKGSEEVCCSPATSSTAGDSSTTSASETEEVETEKVETKEGEAKLPNIANAVLKDPFKVLSCFPSPPYLSGY